MLTTGARWPLDDDYVREPGLWWLPDERLLVLSWPNVTEQMCDELAGPIDVVLVGHQDLVGILIKPSGDWEWCEVLVGRTAGKGVPDWAYDELGPEQRFGHNVVLVDTETRIVRHQRFFSFSPHFSKMLQREARDRWSRGIDTPTYNRQLADWHAKHSTVRSALKAGVARTHGGG